MVVQLELLTQVLNETYAMSPIVYNFSVKELEKKVFDRESLDMRQLLGEVDDIFPIDNLSDYDKVLASVECVPQGEKLFNLKFNITDGPRN